MTNSQLISRGELLVSLSAAALLPYPAILSAAENKMRGAFMILSTPVSYTHLTLPTILRV